VLAVGEYAKKGWRLKGKEKENNRPEDHPKPGKLRGAGNMCCWGKRLGLPQRAMISKTTGRLERTGTKGTRRAFGRDQKQGASANKGVVRMLHGEGIVLIGRIKIREWGGEVRDSTKSESNEEGSPTLIKVP